MRIILRKSKSMISFSLVLVMLLSTGLNVQASNDKEAASKAAFGLTNEGDTEKPTNPVDPELPEHEIDPDKDDNGDNGVTNNTGRLRIDYVSNFNFGTEVAIEETQELFAKLIYANANHTATGRIKVPNFVQVTDLRGTADGWTLQVKQNTPFYIKSGEYEGHELLGTTIYLDNILANTIHPDEKASIPNQEQGIALIPSDEYTTVMTAEKGRGTGTHVAYFGEYEQGEKESALTSVKLEIPAEAEKIIGSYEASFTWVLTSAPENGDGDEEEPDEKDELGQEIDEANEGDSIDIDGDEWIILEKNEEEGTAEVIKKRSATSYKYHNTNTNWKWSSSALRTYLNNTYMSKLSPEIQERIVPVWKSTNLPGYGTNTTGDSQMEKIYALSLDEYYKHKTVVDKMIKSSTSDVGFWLRTPVGDNTREVYRILYSGGNISLEMLEVDNSFQAVIPVFTLQYK